METKNISKGLHQIFVSRLMQLIGTILLTVGATLSVTAGAMALGAALVGDESAAGLAGATVAGSVILIVGVVLLIIGLIFALIGLGNAAKDDERFKTVLLFALISLACSIISSFVGAVPFLSAILKIVATVLDLLVIILTIKYTSDILAQKGRADLAESGNKIQMLILVIVIINLIVSIVAMFGVLAAILSIVSLVLSIVYWFAFMIFLSRSSKALA